AGRRDTLAKATDGPIELGERPSSGVASGSLCVARRRCNSARAAASSRRNAATLSCSQGWVAIKLGGALADGERVTHEKWQEHLRPHRRDAFGASQSLPLALSRRCPRAAELT